MGMAAMVGVRPARGQTAPPAAPPAAAEVAGDRTIGPQDFLEITMTDVAGAGVKSLAKARVDEKGNVVLPVVGSVKAVGLTREELEKAIAQNYRDKNLTQNSTVSVKFIEKGAATANAIELFTDAEISKMDPVMKQKKAERDAIAARIVALRAEGTGDDGPELAKARAELAVAERALREMRDVQAKTQEDSARRPGAAVRTAIDELTPRQISMVDPVMKKLQAERDAIMDRVVQLRAKGLGDDHPDMAKAEAELAMAERKMEVYAHDWRDMQKRLAQDEAPRPGAAVPIPLLPAPGAQAPPVAAAVGGVQLDLVNLANTLVDAAGAVRVAKVNLDARKRMADAGGGSDVQLATAESNLQTAAKRLELLKGIASIALETARTDAKRAEQLYKQGAESEQAFSEAMSKMKMLELIVKGVD
jgi:protein involved in polysaccharide export with SLBB domain